MNIARRQAVFLIAFTTLLQAVYAGPVELSGALGRLTDHIVGESELTVSQLSEQALIIGKNTRQIGSSPRMINEAFALVEAYEEKDGPLFINAATKRGIKRNPTGGLELDRALFAVQQGMIDFAYTPENLRKHPKLFKDRLFKTSGYFPGAVEEKPNPGKIHTVKINASQPEYWGSPVMDAEAPARRPTGCYLPPGSLARVSVPLPMVGKGYAVRVGAHSWDLKKKPVMKRLDRVSLLYPIESEHTLIANPLGGGIYIEVPYKADAGIVDVKIRNAVRSPFYSARSFDQTTSNEWRKERSHPGPWTDFETDKFMMQVPTSWIYNFDNPEQLMKDWGTALDSVSTLFGLPLVRNKSVLYLQVDVVLRGGANFPGYPQSNTPYNPYKKESGNSNHWLLKGPQTGGAITFHEIGHAQLFTKFRGEVEAVVNLPFVAVLNKGFGVDLDTAFGRSFNKESVSLDQAAVMWMVTENFRQGKPMDITNSERNQVRYQHRGYGKYVEIVNLFGWHVLEEFWHSVHLDYLKGIKYSRNADPTDNRILRLSKKAGTDLTPLIHFWGVQPDKPETLKKEMEKAGLKSSPLIYDRLLHYKTVVPMSGSEFGTHAKIVNPKGIRKGKNPNFGEGWYFAWLPKYNEAHGVAAQEALQDIIDLYFPKGRP